MATKYYHLGFFYVGYEVLFTRKKNSEVQWILVAGEETFAIPENLRFYVAAKNSSDFHYLGHAMKFWNVIYNWADAGYVISKGTLDKMMQKFDSDEACDKGGQYWKNSDWYLAKHLSQMNIKPVDTRDHIGRSRFIGNTYKYNTAGILVLCYLILH